VFYAWFKDERTSYGNSAIDRIGEVIHEVEASRLVLVVSVDVRSEVYASKLSQMQNEAFRSFLGHPSVEEVSIDPRIADLAGQIRTESKAEFGVAVGNADARHLAAAMSRDVLEFHTFENEKNKNGTLGLKKLDGHKIIGGMKVKAPRLPPRSDGDLFDDES